MAQILLKRGLSSNLPTLSQGELAFTTDTKSVYVGDGSSNYKVNTGLTWITKTSTYTASHLDGIFADTRNGTFVITLPSSPSVGDVLMIDDVAENFDSNKITIDRNGEKLNGVAKDASLQSKSMRAECIYSGTTFGWRVYPQNGYVIIGSTSHIVTGDTTPDVSDGDITFIIIAYNSPLTITDFDNPVNGLEITILFKTDQTTIKNNASIELSDGIDFSGDINDVLTLTYNGTKWIETSKVLATYNN